MADDTVALSAVRDFARQALLQPVQIRARHQRILARRAFWQVHQSFQVRISACHAIDAVYGDHFFGNVFVFNQQFFQCVKIV